MRVCRGAVGFAESLGYRQWAKKKARLITGSLDSSGVVGEKRVKW
jgi:hypothetical protein